jgi:mannose-6-phosphate isomerase-like protein (cupin superfamily)
MELKSTLKVFNAEDVPAGPGIVPGLSLRRLVGDSNHPTERIMVSLGTFKPGTIEHLHWHLIEGLYFVISGRAVMADIEGKTYDIGPGSVIYAPPGIAASHAWEIKEPLQLISIRATTDLEKTIQFNVNQSTMESSIEFDYLVNRHATHFKKSLY